ncbi:MAG: adenosylmethionine decarboxylase [Bacteroidetes bacterium]|jgi:S-adenosylmethionine decarboxylase|nr:adenosylmethionine decarboxylase [Bacteroidota bacterium]
MDYLGNHMLAEFHECDSDVLNNSGKLEQIMTEAAKLAGATVVSTHFHSYSPTGQSGVVVIQESHFAIHTWPEYNYAAVDLFTCSAKMDFEKAYDYLIDTLGAGKHSFSIVPRGYIKTAMAGTNEEME